MCLIANSVKTIIARNGQNRVDAGNIDLVQVQLIMGFWTLVYFNSCMDK